MHTTIMIPEKTYLKRYLDIRNPTDISHLIFVSDIQTILSRLESENLNMLRISEKISG
jgi:hypothetical protein